ncbi:uncharacterized protein magl [Pempheris klunzingeri]|uniref:uncharacterized protein magl n=1 Tax=Pempheris klunzingeri TaxID=3127111 RepID=UPI003980F02D
MMPATVSELPSVEDSHALEDEDGTNADVPSLVPPATVPSSTPLVPTTTRPNFTSETIIETKAVSMASNDCSSALSSPAEASPAKPAVTSPTAFDGSVENSPATSHIASASDSLKCTGTSLVNISESPSSLPVLPTTTFGGPDLETDFPAVLTFKGVSVTLENNSVWKQFYSCGTEMILTKQGRRMFPYCRYRLSGLDPERQYSLVLSIVPSDKYRYRWSTSKWEITGAAEHQAQGLIRASSHHYAPCRGSDWMNGSVSFYKLKLTNNSQDQEGHIILHSMHRYIPRLHVIPVPVGDLPTPDQPIVMGPESMTFTFPQTEFMAVTTYQNFRITQLKINHNPFAKGFREDGNNSRLNRLTTETQPVLKTDTQPADLQPANLSENKNEVVDLSMKNHTVSASPSNEKETRPVLKPIMSTSARNGDPYVPCIRGKHALGELVLVQNRPLVEPKEETHAISVTPEEQQHLRVTPLATSRAPTSTMSTPGRSPGYRKRRKRINRRWANSRGREWKPVAASPTVVHSPSLTVAMQPELDDVEGLLFVSFTSKEALEVHVRDKPANGLSASPVPLMTLMNLKQSVEVSPETDEEKMSRFEAILLQDLRVLKHRQVIHPVLQEVGLKLSSLDPAMSIDLRYLGIHLPLPPPNPPEQGNTTSLSPGDEGLPFISRTGKTSDMTKIKGWKNKFIKSKETPLSKSDGSPKNLSAFCSNMLDEYLESEAQCISERAAAFSTTPEGSVAYQLPAKSSSYVKTLDSVLKHQNAASSSPAGANKPCPLSHKPLLYSALMSPAPPLASPATPVQAAAQSIRPSAPTHAQPGAVSTANTGSFSQRLSAHHPGVSQRPAVSFGQRQGMTNRPSGFTKFQFKLFQMEIGALNQGLSRTQLTPDRLSVALSVMLTKQMMPSQVVNVAQCPKYEAQQPECVQEFCRLGCVCSSLQHLNRGPLHCRRPECMFGCACFKRKITKQMESEQQNQPVYSMTNMEHVVQPHPGSRINKLWNHSIQDVDPDPVFVPTSAPLCLAPLKVLKRSSAPRPTQPIQEEDKDPVYRYLESMMTCARVREFNSKPPPEVTIELKIPGASTPNATAALRKTTGDNQLKKCHRTILTQKPEKTQEATSNDTETRKQIEIQSVCQWNKDHQMVLEALCQRMNQNRLSRRFSVGPYRIRPVAKIVMRKPSGSIITYRVRISKPSKASDNDEEEFDDSDDEGHASGSLDEDIHAEDEDGQIEPEVRYGVTPFLSAVLPAGRLRARTKPVGCQAYGLIQVNGKSYNQARLLLGNMGSLHPANRLAAYITGRLHAPANFSCSNSQKSDPTDKINTPGTLHIKAAGTVPPIITAGKTTDLKTSTQPPAQLCQPDCWREGSITLLQHPQIFPTTNPVHIAGQRSSVGPFQNSSTISPVSLTVSPSLKTPSFLGQSGTYSFRICPPANKGTKGRDLPGVTLPGGFTLIQLPKPGAGGAESVNTTNTAGADKAPTTNSGDSAADSNAKWLGLHTFTGAKNLSSRRAVKPELMCNERMPSDESDAANSRQVESNMDFVSEGLSSDSSDYCGEGDEDEEVVDIETIEEARQGMAIAKMKEAVGKALRDSRPQGFGKFFSTFRESSEFGRMREINTQDQMYDEHAESKAVRRRKNHSVLERQRRSEQRDLFDRLQTVLKSDPRAPRLRLLSLALKEIQNLVDTSKYLEEKKRRLTQMQSMYVKELSLLSGKSSNLIKHKLKEICERQKIRERAMKWRPFFSHLLQSRAAILQATAPQPKRHSPPLLQPDFVMAPSQANTHTTSNSTHQTPAPDSRSVPQTVSSPAQAEVTAPSPQASNLPGEPVASVQDGQQQPKFESQQGSVPTSQTECQPQAPTVAAPPQVSAAQDGASPVSSTRPPQPFALPLIRSKTGRIILPSSLKPTGQGFYTLMLMKANQKRQQDGVSLQSSNGNSSKNQEKSLSESDLPLDSEGSGTLEDTASQSSNPEPKRSGVTAPLAEFSLLNRPIFVPSVTRRAVENSHKGGAAAGLNKTGSTACLSFNHVHQIPTSVQPKAKPRSAAARRRPGRPRKKLVSPDGDNEQRAVVEDSSVSVSESETSVLAEERQSEKTTLEETKTQSGDFEGMVSDNPVPVKRRRGRPPKNKSTQAGSSPSKSEDSPVRLSRSFRSSDSGPKQSPATAILPGASRPLTRGALGKDFPSAKKRSWIDVEKELEPEVDSE